MHRLGSISAISSEKKIFLYFPIWSCVNTMTCGGGHLGFQIITKNTNLIKRPFNDHSCTEWVHSAQQFLRKRFFLYFPIWYCVKTMSCMGNHLGFRIGIKNPNFRGPSNDYSWAVWFQLSKWFKRRSVLKHFPHRVQC